MGRGWAVCCAELTPLLACWVEGPQFSSTVEEEVAVDWQGLEEADAGCVEVVLLESFTTKCRV